MRSTLNFDKTTASYSGIFVQGFASLSPRCDSIIKEVKVGNKFPPPQWLASGVEPNGRLVKKISGQKAS